MDWTRVIFSIFLFVGYLHLIGLLRIKVIDLYFEALVSCEINSPIVLVTVIVGIIIGFILWCILMLMELVSVLLRVYKKIEKMFSAVVLPAEEVSP